MKKLLISLSSVLMVGCVTSGQAYLPHTSRVFHTNKSYAGCNDPNPIVFQSIQDAANSSGIVPCSICIKTKQYIPSSSYNNSYTQYPSYYSNQFTSSQNIWINPLSGPVSGASANTPSYNTSGTSTNIGGTTLHNVNGTSGTSINRETQRYDIIFLVKE